MKLDINILNEYFENGLLIKKSHPTYPLIIWNYSRKVQLENLWDEVTIQTRGLVTDFDGNIIARCFNKFFNYEQLESVGLSVPNENFDVFEKMDGSLIVVFWYDNQWICASRSSFDSEYSSYASKLIKKFPLEKLSTELTYCFELLWKERPIVIVPLNDSLILLGAFNTKTGEEIDIQTECYKDFNIVKKHNGITDYKKIKETIGSNREGVVVRFKSGFRMKIKGEEYLRLHKIVTKFSTIDIWKVLKDGEDISEYLENVPDEFDIWVNFQISKFKENYNCIWLYYVNKYNEIFNKFNGDLTDKKTVALEVLSNYSKDQKVLFNMINEKEIDDIIWTMLRPEFEKPIF